MAQTNSWPNDLLSIATNDVPTVVYAWWSLQYWDQWPPCPINCAPGYPLYYSPSDPNTNRVIYIDDRESGGSFHADDDPLIPPGSGGDGGSDGDGGGGVSDTPSPLSFGTNLCLFLSHPDSNWNAILTISNTVAGTPYEIIVSPILTNALPTWVSAGVWPGADGNTTPIPVELPTNVAYFYDARVWSLSDFLSRPNSGQLLLLPSSTNDIQVMLNGISNNLTPFTSGGSNYVLLDETPLYSVNLGYDASDSGPTNSTTYTAWPQQNILGVLGYSDTLTNLCLSYNPLTAIDVHGFPELQDLECWHCTNLLSVNVTNCPALERTCFEACNIFGTLDLSGDTQLRELRAAFNDLHNIRFGGAGPFLWHLCAHDNFFTNNFDFSQFPSLKELWFWRALQSGPLVVNATNLMSVQVYSNDFSTADLHGLATLGDVEIQGNPAMTNLNLAGCGTATNQIYFLASSNSLPQAQVDALLTNCVQLGYVYGTNHPNLEVHLDGNATPTTVGLTAINTLTNDGWQVWWSGPPSDTPVISDLQATPGTNSATITWMTQIAADSTVYYGLTTSYGSTNTGNSNTTHTVLLTNLVANTLYHYYVTSTSGTNTGSSADNEFLTLGAAPNTNPIVFVCTVTASETLYMDVSNSFSATTNWLWGDGVTNSLASHTFTNAGTYTNYMVMNPASALAVFGVECGTGAHNLDSVDGLTNYPYLQDLFFYQSGLTNISLVGCSNLVHIALAECYPTNSSVLDGWFNAVSNAEPTMPPGDSADCD
jgi:hypothetical protein